MSLDVTLYLPHASESEPRDRIYIRRGGQTVEITRTEWDEMFPDREPVVLRMSDAESDLAGAPVFDGNITRNMGRMARECGQLYDALWRPDEHGWSHARDLITPLRNGLAILQTDHDRLQQFNPENGWGDYDGLLAFASGYLAACREWPDAEVSVWR